MKKRVISSKIISDTSSQISTTRSQQSARYTSKNPKPPQIKASPSRGPPKKRTPVFSNKYRSIVKATSKTTPSTTQKPPTSTFTTNKFTGLIIFNGRYPLNPLKWLPQMPENHPDTLSWKEIGLGAQVLDQNTNLVWLVSESPTNSQSQSTPRPQLLSLAPCQTIRADLKVPPNLAEFSPDKCRNPYLPKITQIPIGTIFVFKNSSQTYRLTRHYHLEPTNRSRSARPPQIVPIPINTMYNTQYLNPLHTPIPTTSTLQIPSSTGYSTLESWLLNLNQGSLTKPGHLLTELPHISTLQPNDILHFYDPNPKSNPQIHGINPDGSIYLPEFHESRQFNFKLLLHFDLDPHTNPELLASPITTTSKGMINHIYIPTQPSTTLIRSVTLIPNISTAQDFNLIPLQPVNPKPYRLPQDSTELQTDLRIAISQLPSPYNKIRLSYLGKSLDAQSYLWRWSNLPPDLQSITYSSDIQPSNRFAIDFPNFLIFHSTPSLSTNTDPNLPIYTSQLDLPNHPPMIHTTYIDGVALQLPDPDGYLLQSNWDIDNWIRDVNHQLQTQPNYHTAALSLTTSTPNPHTKPPTYQLLLTGIQPSQILPEIMLKVEIDNLIPLTFINKIP